MHLQKQLKVDYHRDYHLQDGVLTAIYIPAVLSRLRDRIPCTRKQTVNGIETPLSDLLRSTGTTSAFILSRTTMKKPTITPSQNSTVVKHEKM